jgi:uncharacterized protein (UPF0332 family)
MQLRRKDLCDYRLQKSKDDLKAAEVLLQKNMYAQTMNRSYYAIFHAVRAMFALDGFEVRKHSGLIAYFNKDYVATGIFDKEYSKILMAAEKVRNRSDYDDFYIVSREAAEKQFESAKKFILEVETHIINRDNPPKDKKQEDM